MFKTKWDRKNNGIILSNKISKDESITAPRPVFFEELDLLGFNDNWNYPKSKEPLLWAVGRKYFYKGVFVAEAKGGNIYDKPEIIIKEVINPEPIDLNLLIKNNIEALKVLEGEAIDFIQDTYKKYKKKVDLFTVAFSGGKDSQVVLDLVSRVLAPDQYIAIFTDTTMELPYTYETVENTRKFYKELYPNLQFYIAKPQEHSLDYWRKFGPPSRIHRWCCSVYKTAPFAQLVKGLDVLNGNKKILVFEGVRSEESNQRRKYNREAHNVKHINIINQRIILSWNLIEVYLYLFYRKIQLNKGYRLGFQRVGCTVCPFSSEWSEYLTNRLKPDLFEDYFSQIKSILPSLGINNTQDKIDYIEKGNWKKRAGGKGLSSINTNVDLVKNNGSLKAIIHNPKENLVEWMKILNKSLYKFNGDIITGETRVKKQKINFKIESLEKSQVITFSNYSNDVITNSILKKIIYKSAFCVHCNVCEVECPKDAISFKPNLYIDTNLCIHCFNCINFSEKGCLNAKSASLHKGSNNMKTRTSGIDRYSTFGLRVQWLEGFLENPVSWLENNNLGPKQKPAMNWWLRESSLLDNNNNPTELTKTIRTLRSKDINLVWQLIWINLSRNSKIVNWYLKLSFDSYNKNELLEMIKIDFPDYSEGTLSNPLNALINTFDNSPLGSVLNLGRLEKKGRATKTIRKIGTNEINPISIIYSLYMFAHDQKRFNFTVSELYHENCINGPYKLFGLSKDKFENILRGLQEDKNQLVRVDLAANLDNIFLNENYTAQEVLELNISK